MPEQVKQLTSKAIERTIQNINNYLQMREVYILNASLVFK